MTVELWHDMSVETYNQLRRDVGWEPIEPGQARDGLRGTRYLVVAVGDCGKPIGLTRIVSDGGYLRVMLDVIVLPEYQKMGIGKLLMQKALTCIQEELQPGQKVLLYMMSAKGKESFYKKYGFEQRPTSQFGAGMTQWIERE